MAIIETRQVNSSQQESLNTFITDIDQEDFVLCKSPDKLKRLIDAICPGKLIHFVSDGDWSMHDLVIELLKKHSPAELFMTTYALREFAVRQLLQCIEKKQLIGVNILIDTKSRTRTPSVVQLAEANINRISFTDIHAKVTIIKTADITISINCSANWTSNPRIESGTISCNPSIADFHIDWITQKMDHAELF